MIEVELWYYATSETCIVRFSRRVTVSAVPFTGSYIDFPGDNLKVGSVTFHDGGGILIYVDNEDNQDHSIRPDSELEDFIEEMKENGWVLLSNVKKRRGRS